jgi:hypothetical protein
MKAQKRFEKEMNKKDLTINRLKEENDRLKMMANMKKESKREATQEGNKISQKLISENKKLEQQRNELLSGFKKQIKLIDLLKRQITHLEAAQM